MQISHAMNNVGGTGLWSEEDGFYYDQIQLEDEAPHCLRGTTVMAYLPPLSMSQYFYRVSSSAHW